jgi:hypothetical protein
MALARLLLISKFSQVESSLRNLLKKPVRVAAADQQRSEVVPGSIARISKMRWKRRIFAGCGLVFDGCQSINL